ncbi:MAG: hypothetical protein R3C99_24010 [Pirellulaceae bacterium]|nr:hypothetical protein [Planctomycetales bacterium]MCA9210280.1 hypothetical protein [Planctomycetales bacterium]MCA9228868.1 hypothetical protein [Planctomycetales bacterium]
MTSEPPEKFTKASPALKALRRAAKQALALARQTGTPCWVMDDDGKIIDIAKRPDEKPPKRRQSKSDP